MKPFTNDIWLNEANEIGLNSEDTVVCLHSLAERVCKIAHGYRTIAREASRSERGLSLALASAKIEQMLEHAGYLINQASIIVRIDENYCNKDNA